MAEPLPSFDPDFATSGEWAAMYRACGLQVVPARYPMRDRTDKRPRLANWKEFQNELVGQTVFDSWFGREASPNMGLITGRASGNVFVVDLDEQTHAEAAYWWRGALEVHNSGFEPETWSQVTGGGGRQLFFRAPAEWHAPTNRTPIGVDIRGQGGFAMLPPSRHLSGREYAWAAGCEPWSVPVLGAPEWLLEVVDRLVEQFGGDTGNSGSERAERVPGSGADFDAFGARVDGREDAMTQWVWRSVLELHRSCGGLLPDDDGKEHFEKSLDAWLRATKTRLKGVDNTTGLERECRGPSAFLAKWKRAMTKWHARVAREAGERRKPDPFAGTETHTKHTAEEQGANDEFAPKPARFVFETVADLRRLPPATWLVKGWIPSGGTGVLYGKWAAGKSFIGFDLALHLAYGMLDWHGAELPEGGCDVLVLAREGHAGFVGRVDAFKRHHGIIEDTSRLVFMRAAISFMRDEDFASLCAAVRATRIRFGLVVIDTVARVLPGVDMNEQQTVTLFMERCQILAEVTGAAAIGVHHQNKSGSMMGSTYFEANADFVFEVSRLGEEDEPLREGEVLCTKMKDGEDRWRRAVTYRKVGLSDIDPEPASLVVQGIKATGNRQDAPKVSWPDRQVCHDIIAAITKAWANGDPWSSYPQAKRSGRYAAKLINAQWGISLGIAEHMIETWLMNDVLAIGTSDKRNQRVGLKVIGSIG